MSEYDAYQGEDPQWGLDASDEFDLAEDDETVDMAEGLILHPDTGAWHCMTCGLCQPGDEEWDWCDHRTGHGCAYNDAECANAEDEDEEADDGTGI